MSPGVGLYFAANFGTGKLLTLSKQSHDSIPVHDGGAPSSIYFSGPACPSAFLFRSSSCSVMFFTSSQSPPSGHILSLKISKTNPRLIKRFYPMIRPDSFQWRHRAGKRGVPHPIQETSSNAGENNQKEDSDAGTIWVDRCSWWSAHEVGSMGI